MHLKSWATCTLQGGEQEAGNFSTGNQLFSLRGKKEDTLKSLGTLGHVVGSILPGQRARLSAAWQAWFAYERVFRTPLREAPLDVKLEVFKGAVDGALLSGLAGRVVSIAMEEALKRFRTERLRWLLAEAGFGRSLLTRRYRGRSVSPILETRKTACVGGILG